MKNYLSKRDDFGGLNFFDDAFSDVFNNVFGSRAFDEMKTDVKENENGYELSVDMPGFNKGDINLSLNNGYLTVESKREEKEEDSKKYLRRERKAYCSRSFYVGDNIKEEDIKAKYDNGTLVINLPKEEKKQIANHNIEIE